MIGTIYPAAYQQFKVGPNEYQAEKKYIDRNIRATRDSFGLDQVETDQFDFTSLKTGLSIDEARTLVDTNSGTINNARLWDPNVIRDTYSTLQNLQTYYQIGDVDVDRYLIDGETRQVLIAARGLNSADLPSQSFVNRHIVYTHGYGAVASPSNEATADGNPNFVLSDVPVKENGITMDTGPPSQIYFAENLTSYVLTGAEQAEFNYQRRARPTSSRATRARTASSCRTSCAAPRSRCASAASTRSSRARSTRTPSCSWSATSAPGSPSSRRSCSSTPIPYPVVLGNRTVWVMDGYTTTDQYPYAQTLGGEGSLSKSFNYVRNSVKVTVDAYQGTVTFYVFDKKDPIIKAYEEAFPDLFTDGSRMPEEIRAHLRYPEDLFKSQASMFGRYHVTEPKRFYDGSAKWLVSPDPGRVASRATSSPRRPPSPAARRRRATSRRPRRRPAPASTPTTSTSACRGRRTSTSSCWCRSCRCRRPTARRDSCRSSPPTPIRASTASCSRSPCRRVRPSRARCR